MAGMPEITTRDKDKRLPIPSLVPTAEMERESRRDVDEILRESRQAKHQPSQEQTKYTPSTTPEASEI